IDYQTTDPTKQFNLTATEYSVTNGIKSIVSTETFRNLVVDPTNQYDVAAVVNAGSQLIKVTEVAGATARPAPTGTISGVSPSLAALAKGDSLSFALGTGTAIGPVTLPDLPVAPAQVTLAWVAGILQGQVRSLGAGKGFDNATVSLDAKNTYLTVKS